MKWLPARRFTSIRIRMRKCGTSSKGNSKSLFPARRSLSVPEKQPSFRHAQRIKLWRIVRESRRSSSRSLRRGVQGGHRHFASDFTNLREFDRYGFLHHRSLVASFLVFFSREFVIQQRAQAYGFERFVQHCEPGGAHFAQAFNSRVAA